MRIGWLTAVVALILTPLVLVYQGWTYYVFRARVTGEEIRSPGEPLDRAADQPSTPRATT